MNASQHECLLRKIAGCVAIYGVLFIDFATIY